MGSDSDSDRSEIDPKAIEIFEAAKKRRMDRRALSPRVVMLPLEISPGTLAAYKGTPPSTSAETAEEQSSGLSAPADQMVVVLSSPEPSLMMEEEVPEGSAARKRTAPITPPIPSPRRVSPDITAAAVRPGALNVELERANRLLEKLTAQVDQLTEMLKASEQEKQALRRELELYRTGTRTVLELHSSAVGAGLGNQAASKPGPSKRTAKRSELRARAEARKAQTYGPAHQRLLELQDVMRAEAVEELRQQQRFGGQTGWPQGQHLQLAEGEQQQRVSYRDALTTGWQVVGERRKSVAPKPPQPKQQRPQPPRATQRTAQPAQKASRRRPDAILVIPAEGRLLELQDAMRAEAVEEMRQQQRFGDQAGRPQGQHLQFAEREQQQRVSYRYALTTGWQVVGERRKSVAPKPPQPKQQRPQPPRAPQLTAQPAQKASRRRPDAILVIPAEGVSFADMYRPIRTAPALEEAQKFIRIGKRTPKGNLRMELTREVDSKALCEKIQLVLGHLGTAKVLIEMAEVIVRNVDYLTQEETLREVLREALAKEPTVASIRMWELSDATKRARIRLARAEAEAIMDRTNPLLIDHFACRMKRVPKMAASQR
uniref:Uncharacterized protein n=1 Tax=Anopheles maculatus TaxID=74869 RepID=A0A182S892_9DIPT